MASQSGLYDKSDNNGKEIDEVFRVPLIFKDVFERYKLKEAGFDIK